MKGRRMWTLEHLAAMVPGDTITTGIPSSAASTATARQEPKEKRE